MIKENGTKIIATIGPSTLSVPMLTKIKKQGVTAARINTAHGDFDQYKQIINNIRKVGGIGVIFDIKGPELRLRISEEKTFKKGEQFTFGRQKQEPYLNYDVGNSVKKGDKILIQDGAYSTTVQKVTKTGIVVKADNPVVLKPNKGVNIPNTHLDVPFISPKDRKVIEMAKKYKVEFLALSFCQSKDDIMSVRRLLKGTDIGIIAKIENQAGVDNLVEISEVSEGIMVARGDLGVEIPAAKIPVIQKQMVNLCNAEGKFVIVATEMLKSMVHNPKPTRAEVSDVANAIFDGADMVMLSDETTIGDYPEEAVAVMNAVSKECEPYIGIADGPQIIDVAEENFTMGIHALYDMSRSISTIVCLDRADSLVGRLASVRSDKPIVYLTDSDRKGLLKQMHYHVHPVLVSKSDMKKSYKDIIALLRKKKILSSSEGAIFFQSDKDTTGKETYSVHVENMK